jgi:hypothetical protein
MGSTLCEPEAVMEKFKRDLNSDARRFESG